MTLIRYLMLAVALLSCVAHAQQNVSQLGFRLHPPTAGCPLYHFLVAFESLFA